MAILGPGGSRCSGGSRFCAAQLLPRERGDGWPNVLTLSEYTDKIAGKSRAPRMTFGTASRGPALRRANSEPAAPGPGQYRAICDFVVDESRECRPPLADRPNLSSNNFGREARQDAAGVLKGVLGKAGNEFTNPLGPGHYDGIAGPRGAQAPKSAPSWSVPKGHETQEQLRFRKANWSPLGPGAYEIGSPLATVSADLERASLALPRSQKRCRHEHAFEGIFAAMKSGTLGRGGDRIAARSPRPRTAACRTIT